MRILVFNSKGGCGKSLLTREVIAAPNASDTVIVEIDTLNQTQLTYKTQFKNVIELDKSNIEELLILLNEHDNVVVDVGADNLTATLNTLVIYQLFDDIDLVIIPMSNGRTDCENALKTYTTIGEHTQNIIFAFSRRNEDEKLEDQYQVFFNNMQKAGLKSIDGKYITIRESDLFSDAQNEKELVINLAKEVDYKKEAMKAKADNNKKRFDELMRKELYKRAAKILVNECILPAHSTIMKFANK
jgi:hypothetical protein